jgi:hypothetical protein
MHYHINIPISLIKDKYPQIEFRLEVPADAYGNRNLQISHEWYDRTIDVLLRPSDFKESPDVGLLYIVGASALVDVINAADELDKSDDIKLARALLGIG